MATLIGATLQAVSERAAQTLKWMRGMRLARPLTSPSTTSPWAAPRSTRRFWRARPSTLATRPSSTPWPASAAPATQDHVPRGLLTRAWLRFLEGHRTGPESAQSDLDEAWEIAERGPMKLHMADIHLHRARLFFREAQVSLGIPRRRSRRRARAHREMRLRAAQGGAGGCRAGDWRGRSLTPSWPPPS